MKQFLIRSVLFVAVLWAVFHLTERVLDAAMLKARPGEVAVWDDLFKGKAGSDVIIHGSSRAWVHVNPAIISDSLGLSCYNLGIDGHSFQLQELRNDLLFRYNTPPKVIVHSIDMWTLVDRGELYGDEQFLPFFNDTGVVRHIAELRKSYHRFDYYLPLTRYFGHPKMMKLLLWGMASGTWPEPERERGFQGQDRPWLGDLEKARESFADGYKVFLDSNITHRFDAYLGQMKAKGIPVILIYTPELKEGQGFVASRDSIMNLYHRMAAKHGLTFLDYSNHPLSDNANKPLYYNASHLNYKGAELFSCQLAHDLKALPELRGVMHR